MKDTAKLYRRYRVAVYYREPTYEISVGSKKEPYVWVYTIEASSPESAKSEALRQFNETTHLSSVGWVRQVVSVEVEQTNSVSNSQAPA